MGRTKRDLELRLAEAIGAIEDDDVIYDLWNAGLRLRDGDGEDHLGAYIYNAFRKTDAWPYVKDFVDGPTLVLEKPKDREDAAELLAYLIRSFNWESTTQGDPYWNEIYNKVERKYGGVLPAHIYPEVCPQNVEATAAKLEQLFTWDETEEGGDFWVDVYYNLVGVANEMREENSEPVRDPYEVKRAAELILESFYWTEAPGGFPYWNNVVDNLRDLCGLRPDRNNTIKNHPSNVREAADIIMDEITWRDTPQGEDYWDEVHLKLLEVAENLKVTNKLEARG